MRATLLLVFAACVPDVPDEPSFQTDVLPVLAAHCLRCHGSPPIGGAPFELRLDSFADSATYDPTLPGIEVPVAGAAAYAGVIAARLRDPVSPMPPRFPLDDWQLAVLERWAATAARGAPRPDNRPPEIAIERVAATATGALPVRARISDPDGDVVGGALRAVVGADELLVGAVRSGVVEVAWSHAGVPPGTYPLIAVVDDGAEVHRLDAGSIVVAP